MAETKAIAITAGVFIIMALVGTSYLLPNENVFFCNDTQLVGICFDLSKVNDDGLQTRCYYNESASTKYKNCKSGWIDFKDTKIIGTIENTTDYSIDFTVSTEKKDILIEKNIIDPTIKKMYKEDNMIKFTVFEEGGINKEIEFIYIFCSKYKQIASNNDSLYETNEIVNKVEKIEYINSSNCLTWYELSTQEIEEQIEIETNKVLDMIADVFIKRDNMS